MAKTFRQFALHKLGYYDCKERFELSAQVVVRCEAKVADAYKLDTLSGTGKKTLRTFSPHGAIAYDDRILKWKLVYPEGHRQAQRVYLDASRSARDAFLYG